jgi:hypothetical protein
MLVDLDPRERLTPILAIFRSSGRLFWLPYYAALSALLVAPSLFLRRRTANLLLCGALALQLVDTIPMRRWVHATVNGGYSNPLQSPIWSELGAIYANLVVLPPWQCDHYGTPGGVDGYRIFGLLAADQNMRINSYYSGRQTERALAFHCSRSIAALSERTLSPDTAYVVTPALAALIAEGPTGPGQCHDLDGFILCSPKNSLGLSARLKDPADRLQDSLHNSGFEEGGLSPWTTFRQVRAQLSTSHVHSGMHSLAEVEGGGSVYQDISGLEPGKRYLVTAWVSASRGGRATAQVATYDPTPDMATFSATLMPDADWQRVYHTFTASPSGGIRLHLFRGDGDAAIYWDDVRIYGGGEGAAVPSTLR